MLKRCPFDSCALCNKPIEECDNCLVKNKASIEKEIVNAFVELLDGVDYLDIHSLTELDVEKSKTIKNIWNKAIEYGYGN